MDKEGGNEAFTKGESPPPYPTAKFEWVWGVTPQRVQGRALALLACFLTAPPRDTREARRRGCVSLTLAASVYHAHMTSADLIREIEKAGWRLDRVRGSHHVFKHATRLGHVVVPHPKKDLGKGLVAQIRKDAGLSWR